VADERESGVAAAVAVAAETARHPGCSRRAAAQDGIVDESDNHEPGGKARRTATAGGEVLGVLVVDDERLSRQTAVRQLRDGL